MLANKAIEMSSITYTQPGVYTTTQSFTPTVYIPLTTPGPAIAACSDLIYSLAPSYLGGPSLLAFDPFYQAAIETNAGMSAI